METIRTRQLDHENTCLRKALAVALAALEPHEPGDSRAVSAEFVAMAAVQCGDYSLPVMCVIDRAFQRTLTQESCSCGAGAEPCPGPDGRPLCAVTGVKRT